MNSDLQKDSISNQSMDVIEVDNISSTTTAANENRERKNSWFSTLTQRKQHPAASNNTNIIATTLSNTNSTTSYSIHINEDCSSEMHVNNDIELASGNANATVASQLSNNKHMNDLGSEQCSLNSPSRDGKNLLQRWRKKLGLRMHIFRRSRHSSNKDDNGMVSGTTDASDEFVTHSPIHEPLSFNFIHNCHFGTGILSTADEDETEIVPFTNDFKRFLVKKWLENADGANRIMYKASCEMLNQVWYWGEISRRDAQKQLTDKPTGSFLVRDSETSGCQFTLSFRISNVTLHYRLEHRDNYWHFEELQYESIVEMIEDILYRCTSDNFVCFVKVPNEMQPPFPVILKYPLSRYLNIPKLQDLCRRIIQRNTSLKQIACLPIPPTLQEYLAEQRQLVF